MDIKAKIGLRIKEIRTEKILHKRLLHGKLKLTERLWITWKMEKGMFRLILLPKLSATVLISVLEIFLMLWDFWDPMDFFGNLCINYNCEAKVTSKIVFCSSKWCSVKNSKAFIAFIEKNVAYNLVIKGHTMCIVPLGLWPRETMCRFLKKDFD